MELVEKLNMIDNQIKDLVQQRNGVLSELRKRCKHLRLVELKDSPPQRICADCGAEERGWHYGYHVLVTRDDSYIAPYKEERVLIQITDKSGVFYSFRKPGPLYRVGQSHPNFGRGIKTYQQLTDYEYLTEVVS